MIYSIVSPYTPNQAMLPPIQQTSMHARLLLVPATLGSRTTELSLLSSHRPVLAFLLVLGSPAVNPIRTYDYPDSKVEVREKKWRWDFPKHSQIPKRSQTRNIVCVIIELFFAIGSVANLAELC